MSLPGVTLAVMTPRRNPDDAIVARAVPETVEVLTRLGVEVVSSCFVARLTPLTLGLTLRSFIEPGRQIEAVVLKNLYAAWNVLLDASSGLVDSAVVLAGGPAKARTPTGACAGELVRRASALAPAADPGPLLVTLSSIIASHHFEHVGGASVALADPHRWLQHQTTICSRDPHLAIDLLASAGGLSERTYRELSRLLCGVGSAIAIANAVHARGRDRRRGKVTIIDMWARDAGLSEQVALQRACRRARALMARARHAAEGTDVADLPTILDTAEHIVESHLGPHPFPAVEHFSNV